MHEPKGRYLPLAGPRRFIGDLVHFAHRIPSAPVSRTIDLSALAGPRVGHPARPSWASVFMKAYALVGAAHPPLRRSMLEFPWPRLYEHPWMNCALAIERTYHGEEGVFVGLFRAPEKQSLVQLQKAVEWYKNETLEKVGFYRMALRFSQAPTPIRRLLWWGTLNISGYKRCKRFGTFGLSSYGSLGRRADPSDLTVDNDADLWADRPDDAPGRRQADLRSSRAGRVLHRPPAPRHRRHVERPDPRGTARRTGCDDRSIGRILTHRRAAPEAPPPTLGGRSRGQPDRSIGRLDQRAVVTTATIDSFFKHFDS